jgi:hypothetical protein
MDVTAKEIVLFYSFSFLFAIQYTTLMLPPSASPRGEAEGGSISVVYCIAKRKEKE